MPRNTMHFRDAVARPLASRPGDRQRGSRACAAPSSVPIEPLEARRLLAVHAAYAIADLGTLGGPFSVATGINEAGVIVGNAQLADGTTRAFRTLPNQPIRPAEDNLGTLGGDYSSANDVGPGGEVVGESRTSTGAVHAFYVPPGRAMIAAVDDLRTFAAPDGDGPANRSSSAADINALGTIVGVSDLVGVGQRAFAVRAGQRLDEAVDLGTLGGNFSSATAVNEFGSVVGSSINAGAVSRAFRTGDNVPIDPEDDLGTLATPANGGGRLGSIANDVNRFGVVVGSAQISAAGGEHAFRTAAGAQAIDPATDDLGTLGGRTSAANAVNRAGDVVGRSAVTGDEDTRAFFVPGEAGGKMIDLNTLLPPGSGWKLIEAHAINDKGQIVGEGITPAGRTHAFLLSPVGTGTPDAAAPTVTRTAGPTAVDGGNAYTMELTYRDDRGINFATLDGRDVRVRGSAGLDAVVTLLNVRTAEDGSRVVTYGFSAPPASGNPYAISLSPGEVTDTAGRYVPATEFVQFESPGSDEPGGPVDPAAADFAATSAAPLPASAVVGDKGRVIVRLTQSGGLAPSTVNLKLFASTDRLIDASDVALPVTGRAPAVRLSPGQTRDVTRTFVYPQNLPDGGYYILALADPGGLPETDRSNNVAVAVAPGGGAIAVSRPFVDLTAELVGPLPPAVVGGAAGQAVVRVGNAGNFSSGRPVAIALFASTDAAFSDNDVLLVDAPGRAMKLKPGGFKDAKVNFRYPPTLPNGDYFLLARATAVGGTDPNPADNVDASAAPITVAAPFVNLAAIVAIDADGPSAALAPGGAGTASVIVSNAGNLDARGRLDIALSATPAGGGGGGASPPIPLGTLARPLSLRPGASKAYKVRFVLPATIAPEAYALRAAVDAANAFVESDESDNDAVASFTVA